MRLVCVWVCVFWLHICLVHLWKYSVETPIRLTWLPFIFCWVPTHKFECSMYGFSIFPSKNDYKPMKNGGLFCGNLSEFVIFSIYVDISMLENVWNEISIFYNILNTRFNHFTKSSGNLSKISIVFCVKVKEMNKYL